MCKVVRIFQQTFDQTDSQATSGTFKFPRYMKTNPSQYFRIKVLSVHSFKATPLGALFIKDFPVINMNCNYVTESNAEESNRFYLGNLQNQLFVEAPTMLTDDIPMSPFTIFRTMSQADDNDFTVVFQIELLEREN